MSGVGHFKILGPLEIWRAGQRLHLYGPRQERVLLALLLDPDRIVSFDHLTDAVWDEDPPASARRQLQDAVARIRGVFAAGGLPREIIVTTGSGYRLELGGHRLDRADFDRLVSEAQDPALPDAEAVRKLRSALDLWRVPDLSGTAGSRLGPALAALEEKRLVAWESLLRLEIELGTRRELTGELRQLVGRHPLRESLVALLMSALAAEGRVAEAVTAYDQLCRRLDEEIGVGPGPLVRRIRAEIVRDNPDLPSAASPVARAAVGAQDEPDRPIPAQLPPAVSGFVGRDAELDELDALLDRTYRPAVVLSAVTGTAGVGKTALAVHWGHRVLDRFPDGQLYIDLRGYDPRRPLSAGEALDQLLAAFGVAGVDVPVETPARAALLRTLVKGRRLLLLLDNAATPEQVRGLLPGDRGPMVLITSRSSLAGLIARDGAHRIALDRLPVIDAMALLRELIGAQVDREPEAARQLVESCARLPLALRIAAEQAPGRPLHALVERLRDERSRLDVLDADGDEATAVRSVLSWSYRQLDPSAALTFRMLALTPAPDVSAEAVAVLVAAPVDETRRLLDELLRANLVFRAVGGRYGLHDLLRAYGRELADQLGERVAAEEQLLRFYLNSAAAANQLLFPNADVELAPDPGAPRIGFAAREDARAWLDAERATYLALMDMAANDWPGHAEKLASTLLRYLDNSGHHADAAAVHSHALSAARKLGDRARESAALSDLGVVYYRWGQHATAADYFGAADEAARESGNLKIEMRNALNLGLIYEGWGRLDEAEEQYRRVLEISGGSGHEFPRLSAHRNLGDVAVLRNQFDKAIPHYRESSRLARVIDNNFAVALAQQNLALIDLALGRLPQAEEQFRQAGAVFGELGYPSAEAQSTDSIGGVRLRQGRPEEALRQFRAAFEVFESLGENGPQAMTLVNMAEALNGLGRHQEALDTCVRAGELVDPDAHAGNIAGDALRGLGRLDEAVKHHRAALAETEQSGEEAEQARAHRGLAEDLEAMGETAAARGHRREAVAIYRRLGLPEADEVS
jgi:DNA-binding SARP family transcriptional activator/tetratricopeptide (TPR) repeat protein